LYFLFLVRPGVSFLCQDLIPLKQTIGRSSEIFGCSQSWNPTVHENKFHGYNTI